MSVCSDDEQGLLALEELEGDDNIHNDDVNDEPGVENKALGAVSQRLTITVQDLSGVILHAIGITGV